MVNDVQFIEVLIFITGLICACTGAAALPLSLTKKGPGMVPRLCFYVLAKFARLFLQYHLLNASVATARHPVEIHAGGERSAIAVTAIPEDAVISCGVVALREAAHDLPSGIVDVYLHLSGAFKLIAKRGIGVERIRVSIFQLGDFGDGRAA